MPRQIIELVLFITAVPAYFETGLLKFCQRVVLPFGAGIWLHYMIHIGHYDWPNTKFGNGLNDDIFRAVFYYDVQQVSGNVVVVMCRIDWRVFVFFLKGVVVDNTAKQPDAMLLT